MVPGAQLIQTRSVHRVTLVLGSDGKQVVATAAHHSTSGPQHQHAAPAAHHAGIQCID